LAEAEFLRDDNSILLINNGGAAGIRLRHWHKENSSEEAFTIEYKLEEKTL
jgi:hypothetical protein